MTENRQKDYKRFLHTIGIFPMLAAVSLLVACEPVTVSDNLQEEIFADAANVAPTAPATTDATGDAGGLPTDPGTVATTGLPNNPSIPNPTSAAQLWYFTYKDHDNTFRIRWPTYFASQGVGPGSYTTVNGARASFRNYDTDNGAKRPSYSIPGPSSRFTGTITCILYSSGGTALAWFRVNGRGSGSLP